MQDGQYRHDDHNAERAASIVRAFGVVVVVGLALGIFATLVNMYYISAAIGAMLLFIVIAWQFDLALLIYALIAFIPWGKTPDLAVGGSGMGKGVFVSQIMLAFLISIWICRYLFGLLPKPRIKSGYYIPIALYLVYSVINVMHAYVFWDANVPRFYQSPMVNMIELGIRFLSAGAFAMYATSITNKKWLKIISVFIMAPGCFNLLNILSGGVIPVSVPWWPLLIMLPAGYLFALIMEREVKLYIKIIAGAVITLAFVVILMRNVAWVSGWLGLFVCIATVALIRNRRVLVLILAVCLLFAYTAKTFFQENVLEESEKAGDYDRFLLAKGALRYATTFPLGVGVGNYRSYNSFYYGQIWGTTSYTSAHGTYSQHLSEMGFPGFILLCGILLFGFRWVYAVYKEMPPGFSKRFMLAAMGQMSGMAAACVIGDYLLPTYHNGGLATFSVTVYSWVIWGTAVGHAGYSAVEEKGKLVEEALPEHA